jgi:hypothetical protein
MLWSGTCNLRPSGCGNAMTEDGGSGRETVAEERSFRSARHSAITGMASNAGSGSSNDES